MNISDLPSLGPDTDLSSDVLIVGSGPAAWTLAKELSGSTLRILVLESGGGHQEAEPAEFKETEDVGMPLFNGRYRGLGGTTTAPGWANRCIAFDRIDYEDRPWAPGSGWPFGPEEITPYLEGASEYLGAGSYVPDPTTAPGWRGPYSPQVDPHRLRPVHWVFGRDRGWDPTRFNDSFRGHRGDNVQVVLYATVTHLDVDPLTGRVASLEVADPSGCRRTIPSKVVVLCAGGIENPRLLLNSNRQVAAGLGNGYDLVGRYLMDHPRDLSMSVSVDLRRLAAFRALFNPTVNGSGLGRRLFVGGLALSEEVQRSEGLLNCAAWPVEDVSKDDPLEAAIRFARRDRSQKWSDVRRMAAHPLLFARSLHTHAVLDQPTPRLVTKAGFYIGSEQQLDAESRVSLSERRDRFGLPIARTDWRINRQERASHGRLAKLIVSEFERLSLPKATLAGWIEDEAYDDTVLQDGCHPTGTTRISIDPRRGVVDADCQVHGVGGLFIAGSSVFPTASHANPTLMIVAMARRLARHLRGELARDLHPVDQSRVPPRQDGAAWLPVLTPGTNVAVTGANGFIGGRLVEKLTEQGAIVTCLNRGAPSARVRKTGAAVRTLNLADEAGVSEALRDTSIVFHCAYDWADEDWNLQALQALMSACRTNRCDRLVHVSSFVVYETPTHGEVSETTEGTTAQAGYAYVKRAMELELLRAHREDGFPCAILQPAIVYGPHSRPWTTEPAEMLRHGTVVLPDKGEGICAAVYVDDVVDAMIIAAVNPAAVGQRFLVSGPEPVTWAAFYEALAEAAGARPPNYLPFEAIRQANTRVAKMRRIITDPAGLVRRAVNIGLVRKVFRTGLKALPSQIGKKISEQLYGPTSRRRGHVHMPSLDHARWLSSRYTISSAKARREIGYRPQIDLRNGMLETTRFLQVTGDGA